MTETDARAHGGLRGFFDRGGVWRFALFLVVYLAVYLGAGKLVGAVGGHFVDEDLLTSAGSVFFQVTVPLLVGGAVLVAFMVALGWASEIFARQPVYRSWWMWIAPVVVLVPIILRLLGIDWGSFGVGVIVTVLLTGLLIGFVEELLYRGIGVKMVRDGGHGEWVVAAVTSLFFALSHLSNLLSGQSFTTVGPTVLYTLAFGALMYVTMRVSGYLVVAMVLHGLTDPTGILASGGIDEVQTGTAADPYISASQLVTLPLILVGVVLLVCVRGRVAARRATTPDRPVDDGSVVAG